MIVRIKKLNYTGVISLVLHVYDSNDASKSTIESACKATFLFLVSFWCHLTAVTDQESEFLNMFCDRLSSDSLSGKTDRAQEHH